MIEPRILHDPTTGRPILLAPKRRARPHLTGHDAGACPFCPGRELDTPPEVDAFRAPGTAADTPGWTIRAFPNLYPATPWHEVIAEGAVHATQPVELGPELLGQALTMHGRRITALESKPGVKLAFLFKNVGAQAGASIAHNHTQVLGLPLLPPRLELELAHARGRACVFCNEVAAAESEGRLICAGSRHAAVCPRASKLPFEIWVLPFDHHEPDVTASEPEDLARTFLALFRGLAALFPQPPFNFWLHRVPGAGFHWHYEIQLRTGHFAALELGGDMYINSLTGEECAAQLRTAMARK